MLLRTDNSHCSLIFQHALLLPVLVHHVRYHSSLHSLDEKMGYVFKDRALLQVKYKFSDLPSYQDLFFVSPGARYWGGRTRKRGALGTRLADEL